MEAVTEKEYKMIKIYKKNRDQNISLYFFNKFRNDLMSIVFSKINRKYSSIPYEKGDLIHIIWESVKKSLDDYDSTKNFHALLVNNCYCQTVREIKKFINNKELVMNTMISLEKFELSPSRCLDKNQIVNFELSRGEVLDNLIKTACKYVSNYSQPTIKRVIYLKLIGYSISEISRKLRVSRYHIEDLLKNIEKIIKKYYL